MEDYRNNHCILMYIMGSFILGIFFKQLIGLIQVYQ